MPRTSRSTDITAPVDPRLPDGGGYTVSGLHDVAPQLFGVVDYQVQPASDYGKYAHHWNGCRCHGQRTHAEWSDVAARHQHRSDGDGFLRGRREGSREPRSTANGDHRRLDSGSQRAGGQPVRRDAPAVLSPGVRIPHAVPRARLVSRSQDRRRGQHDVPEQPGSAAGGQLQRSGGRRGAVARPSAVGRRRERHRQPDRAGDALW